MKKCWKIMFCWKKFHVLWYLRPFYIVLEVSSAGEFENFSMFRWLLLLLFFVCFLFFSLFVFFCSFFFLFCFCSTWKVVCLQFRMFLLFFFSFKISCWDVFFILGVHSRVRGSPMWCLKVFLRRGHQCGIWKVFSVEVTNVGFEDFYEVSG